MGAVDQLLVHLLTHSLHENRDSDYDEKGEGQNLQVATCLSMKSPSAAKNMMMTNESNTAVMITHLLSVSPTAVMTESREEDDVQNEDLHYDAEKTVLCFRLVSVILQFDGGMDFLDCFQIKNNPPASRAKSFKSNETNRGRPSMRGK